MFITTPANDVVGLSRNDRLWTDGVDYTVSRNWASMNNDLYTSSSHRAIHEKIASTDDEITFSKRGFAIAR
jgi:hypothetical protein